MLTDCAICSIFCRQLIEDQCLLNFVQVLANIKIKLHVYLLKVYFSTCYDDVMNEM